MPIYTCRIVSDPSINCTAKAHMRLRAEDRQETFIAEVTDHNLDCVLDRYGEEARRIVISAIRDTLANPHPNIIFDDGIVARYHPQNDWARQTLNASVAAVMAGAA